MGASRPRPASICGFAASISAPLFGLKPSDTLAQNIRVFSRVSLAGNKLTFDDLDSVVGRFAAARASGAHDRRRKEHRGRNRARSRSTLAPAFALAIGAAGHDAAEPLGAGLLKGWRGRVAFQALRGALPGGSELRPVSGTIRSDGQSLTFDAIKGGIGGGEATANIDARPAPDGMALNARLEFAGVDGAALHYRGLKMPAGRTSLQMTLASQGRSVSALTGALSGSGTVTLESAGIAGLDPRAFDAAIRASDGGQATDDARLRQIVEPVLSAGSLSVASAQIPFTIRDGRLRVGATTLEAKAPAPSYRAATIFPPTRPTSAPAWPRRQSGSATSRPEIQIFAAGPPDALNRSIDVAALSSWLAVRAIDRETRRLDAIERGEPPPPTPASIPPSTAALPPADATAPDRRTSARPRSAPRSAEAESRRSASARRAAGSRSAGREPASRAAAAADRGAAGARRRPPKAEAAPAFGDLRRRRN